MKQMPQLIYAAPFGDIDDATALVVRWRGILFAAVGYLTSMDIAMGPAPSSVLWMESIKGDMDMKFRLVWWQSIKEEDLERYRAGAGFGEAAVLLSERKKLPPPR